MLCHCKQAVYIFWMGDERVEWGEVGKAAQKAFMVTSEKLPAESNHKQFSRDADGKFYKLEKCDTPSPNTSRRTRQQQNSRKNTSE